MSNRAHESESEHTTGAGGEGRTDESAASGDGPTSSSDPTGSSYSARAIGMLSALRDTIERTIQEAKERGDLSPERAREVMDRAALRAREATAEARERLDFVHRNDFEALISRVRELEERVHKLESGADES